MIQIICDRLMLREWKLEDSSDLYTMMSQIEVNKFLPINLFENEEQAEEKILNMQEEHKKGNAIYLAVVLKKTNRVIGYINLAYRQHDEKSGELGYAFAKEYWHQGYATEAAIGFLSYLKELNFTYVFATHDILNNASGKVMQNIGMQYYFSYDELWKPKNYMVTFNYYRIDFHGSIAITETIVKELVKMQFPEYEHLQIQAVKRSGHDNRTFHLGNDMTVRLPSTKAYEPQIEKENKWLPYLQRYLSYEISAPLCIGSPTFLYPMKWSINKWIEGDCLLEAKDVDKKQLAIDLNNYLKELQKIPVMDAPRAGEHNFFRGGDLKVYEVQTLEAIEKLKNDLPKEHLLAIWNKCIATNSDLEVFVHGDVAPGNLLLQHGKLNAIIDFGVLGVGDPSCDYAMAWTYFDEDSRMHFLADLSDDMIQRARGWALWKALITYDDENTMFKENAHATINAILNEKMV